MKGIIFLDRDWVVNKSAKAWEYIKSRQEFVWIDWVKEFILNCNKSDFKVVIITNQQWIGKWLYNIDDLENIFKNINKDLAQIWAKIDNFYFCPHLVIDNCNCRKPKIWMLEKACKDLDFYQKEKMFLVWDSDSDIQCANNFGIKSLKIESDKFRDYLDKITVFLWK
ncbi:MAG: ATP-dependent Clp protease, ATP-binding subunit ClpA [uncultured bacterium (gcode 4)]|uniref:D,D-heptose 1,7-bisphosphate phosphatase n=1 Tax=uncultured bacterium (gcode 4) TaxID=1234023 RepID=K2BVF7_9BACT|nr:MAG: ATP-dependent Clp protease, ATP-binding subunit ClpA [uncultured bacterium (gcode 4)]